MRETWTFRFQVSLIMLTQELCVEKMWGGRVNPPNIHHLLHMSSWVVFSSEKGYKPMAVGVGGLKRIYVPVLSTTIL